MYASLGIDFGTSHTVAAVRRTDGSVTSLLFDGSPMLPSAVYLEPSGELVTGRDALYSARMDPARFEPNPKRRIDDSSLLLGEEEVLVSRSFAAVLGRVREECERVLDGPATEVTLTHPAIWGPTRRLILSDAAVEAGLPEPRLVPEPVAAATYFVRILGEDVPVGNAVVVYDLGGGTFDASVVLRTESGFEVLAVDGSADLGGVDVDHALFTHLGRQLEGHEAWRRLETPATMEERRQRRVFLDDLRSAKERLSRTVAVDLPIPLLGIDTHLTRDELDQVTRPLLDKATQITQAVIRTAALPPDRVAGVFLVGGASRMPLVATMLHRTIGVMPTVIDQPETVVAHGSIHDGESPVSPVSPVTSPAPPAAVTEPRTPPPDRPGRSASPTPNPLSRKRFIAVGAVVALLMTGTGIYAIGDFDSKTKAPEDSALTTDFGATTPDGSTTSTPSVKGEYLYQDPCEVLDTTPYHGYDDVVDFSDGETTGWDHKDGTGYSWCRFKYSDEVEDHETALYLTLVVQDNEAEAKSDYEELSEMTAEYLERVEGPDAGKVTVDSSRDWEESIAVTSHLDGDPPVVQIAVRDDNLAIRFVVQPRDDSLGTDKDVLAIATKSVDDMAARL